MAPEQQIEELRAELRASADPREIAQIRHELDAILAAQEERGRPLEL